MGFDVERFRDELAAAPTNFAVATKLVFPAGGVERWTRAARERADPGLGTDDRPPDLPVDVGGLAAVDTGAGQRE